MAHGLWHGQRGAGLRADYQRDQRLLGSYPGTLWTGDRRARAHRRRHGDAAPKQCRHYRRRGGDTGLRSRALRPPWLHRRNPLVWFGAAAFLELLIAGLTVQRATYGAEPAYGSYLLDHVHVGEIVF